MIYSHQLHYKHHAILLCQLNNKWINICLSFFSIKFDAIVLSWVLIFSMVADYKNWQMVRYIWINNAICAVMINIRKYLTAMQSTGMPPPSQAFTKYRQKHSSPFPTFLPNFSQSSLTFDLFHNGYMRIFVSQFTPFLPSEVTECWHSWLKLLINNSISTWSSCLTSHPYWLRTDGQPKNRH